MKPYDFTAIEKKWQAYWEANKTFRAAQITASQSTTHW